MKTIISFLFIMILTFGVFGQTVTPDSYKGPVSTKPIVLTVRGDADFDYTNYQYGFSVTPPTSTAFNNELNKDFGYISTYSCSVSNCKTPGIFALANIEKTDLTMQSAVRTFQNPKAQKVIAKTLINGFTSLSNPTILETRYVAYNGRPALRIDFNFTNKDRSFTGSVVELFIEEKKIIAVFCFLTVDANSDQWGVIAEKSLRTLKIADVSSNKAQVKIPETISGGVMNGKALTLPKPFYPNEARQYRASGAVNVQVKIDHNGNVFEAKAVSGHESLRRASEQAALQATFKPLLLSGQPVKVIGVIVYNFVP